MRRIFKISGIAIILLLGLALSYWWLMVVPAEQADKRELMALGVPADYLDRLDKAKIDMLLQQARSREARIVQVPAYDITLNGVKIDNHNRRYPIIVLGDIPYFPLDFDDCSFMNLVTHWEAGAGLWIGHQDQHTDLPDMTLLAAGESNEGLFWAEVATIPISFNNKAIINIAESYPFLIFRDLTYLPLTQRFVRDELDWEYSLDRHHGLNIKTRVLPYSLLEAELYSLSAGLSGKFGFSNYVDAYSLELPTAMTVNMSDPQLRAVLERRGLRLEIYRQEVGGAVSSYIDYSNRFKNNAMDHQIEYDGKIFIKGKTAIVLQWSRDKLSRVPQDKNYYASVDLIWSNREVYTFMFKSEQPFNDMEDYLSIVRSFQRQGEPTTAPLIREETPSQSLFSIETAALFEQYFNSEAGLSWGIFTPLVPSYFPEQKAFEQQVRFTFPFVLYYTHFTSSLPDIESALSVIKAEGRYPELTLQTSNTEDGSLMLYDVLNGEYDEFLRAYARIIADLEHPTLMRLCNEMNGDWCSYSAWHAGKDTELFKALYYYVYRIFEEEGAATYTIWVWNPNEKSFPDFKWNHGDLYYPGGRLVDIVGLTGYNTGTYHPGEIWRTFNEIYQPIYAEAVASYNKPLMITEFSCSNVGGNKPLWVRDMFEQIQSYDKIKLAIWWSGADYDANGNTTRSYWINESEALIAEFRKGFESY